MSIKFDSKTEETVYIKLKEKNIWGESNEQLNERAKSLVGSGVTDGGGVARYVSSVENNVLNKPYQWDYIRGSIEGAAAKALGTNDPAVLKEIRAQYEASSLAGNPSAFITQVAANPTAYSTTLGNLKAGEAATKEANPLIKELGGALGEKETESQGYLQRLLASRGIGQSGAVGSGMTDLAGKYAEALSKGSTSILNTANAAARKHETGVYDTRMAQDYSDRFNTQYLNAINAQTQSKQPSIWDYASSLIGLIPGVGEGVQMLGGLGKYKPS